MNRIVFETIVAALLASLVFKSVAASHLSSSSKPASAPSLVLPFQELLHSHFRGKQEELFPVLVGVLVQLAVKIHANLKNAPF